jgi:ATP-dependent helicase HrpB
MTRIPVAVLQKAGDRLPVTQIIPELCHALASNKRAVLQAPPGAGKTTFVPMALLDQPWLGNKKIIMLEPRRLAAKACAIYMAAMLGEKPGQTIGYQIRMERCISPDTRIEVITEGILTQRIQSDPSLEQAGLVIFDEFHERHIHSDLGLALCLEAGEVFNEDLRILVMSATMDMGALSVLMDNAPMISSQGRSYPIVTHYLPLKSGTQARGNQYQNKYQVIRSACLEAIEKALARESGDILVFLPGAAQIRDLAQALTETPSFHKFAQVLSILPLYGNLTRKEQAAAIAPSLPGHRKIVLATSIAETSLTIEGVRVVVDTGLARVPRFSPNTGMSRLDTIPVSKASADQRRGRAGRTGPGVCYRLWSEYFNKGLMAFNQPEILSADLTGVVLELAQWGVSDPGSLKWIDLPPRPGFERARDLLYQLNALDSHGRITDHGKRILSAGVHPRLAHMILRADGIGQGPLACRLAALLGERDILFFDGHGYDPDIRLRLEVLADMAGIPGKTPARKTDRNPDKATNFNKTLARTILKNAAKLGKDLRIISLGMDLNQAGRVLAFAWPERVAKSRNNKDFSFLMASGSGAFFRSANALSFLPYIVAIHLDGIQRNAGIFLAASYDEKDLEQDFKDQIKIQKKITWDPGTESVRAFCYTKYNKLILRETLVPDPDPEAVRACLIQGIQNSGLSILPWTRKLRQLQHRAVFLKTRGHFTDLPDLSDRALGENLAQWLGPFLDHIQSAGRLKQVDLSSALTSLLTWEQQQNIQNQAPTHIIVPSGSRISLQYMDDKGLLESPVLAVRLQEMFGLIQSPAIVMGQIPITLHLLSPAGRPVQITRDLESFWKNTYQAVKKDLKGRYPKHYWPDDPFQARPTSRVKPRGNR